MILSDPDELVALGAFTGAMVLVVGLSAVAANAYRERSLLLHAAATLLGVFSLQLQVSDLPVLAQAAFLLLLALAGLQLRDLVSHAGALRRLRRWLVGACIALPFAALLAAATRLPLLPAGLAAWAAVVAVVMLRAWPQSQPWARWLMPGLAALCAGGGWLAWSALHPEEGRILPQAALLALWSATVYLASSWRSRIQGETRARLDARTTVDPRTGLSTQIVLSERLLAARSLLKRYGHPSVLLLVHIDNLPKLEAKFGPETAESAVLVAAARIRHALGDGDVAARLSQSRIAVLAEGVAPAEGAANLASRILVAGLKEPVPLAPTEFLQFRIVLGPVPTGDISAKAILQRLSARMDEQLFEPSERRIHTLAADALGA